MKLFGFGSKVKDKLTATKFEYTVTIHNLQPWPAGNRAIAIGWQRGKKKRGATRSVYAATAPGRLGNVVRFNEKFEMSATLYKAPGTATNAAQLGPFKKKCLILAVLETDGRTQATAALGRVVIDLAEFAAIENQETRSFQVSCNKQIHAAVGDPQLLITIRTRWKKANTAGPQDVNDDDATSMSTDTTGSRMTANLSSFLRFKYTGKSSDPEQDLKGFEGNRSLQGTRGFESTNSRAPEMPSIQEKEDEIPDSPPRNGQQAYGGRGMTSSLPPTPGGSSMMSGMAPQRTSNNGTDAYADNRWRNDSGGASQASSSYVPPHQQHRPAGLMMPGGGAGMAPAAAATASMQAMYANGVYTPSVNMSPRSTVDDYPQQMHHQPSPSPHSMRSIQPVTLSSDAVQNELMYQAASEVCVYLARAAAKGKYPERNAHAAARRVARTMMCLGPQQGAAFGHHVLRLINSQVAASSEELSTLAFWWSNVAHLRALLGTPALAVATGVSSVGSNADALLWPQLLRVERSMFESVLVHVWETMVVSISSGDGKAAAAAAAGVAKATPATKRAQQEAAIKKWFEALDGVNSQLSQLGNHGHVHMLRQQVLMQCLKKVDALLFYHLLAGEQPLDILIDYDPNNGLWGMGGQPVPAMDESSLPFSKGVLTFGSGMSVKMTVTRLQQWASGEGGLSDGSSHARLDGNTSLFPLLRAAADLLMMPKELLMEPAIRRDVCQALSMRSMIHILEHFQPDEYARDAINSDIISTLKDEQLKSMNQRPPLSDMSVTYRPPSEDLLLPKVLSGMEPGIEYDAESEDEIDTLSQTASMPGMNNRFKLLSDLWLRGVPRVRGAVSLTRSRMSPSSSVA